VDGGISSLGRGGAVVLRTEFGEHGGLQLRAGAATRTADYACCGWTSWRFHEALRSSGELTLVARILKRGALRFLNTWEAGFALFDAHSSTEAVWPSGPGAGTYTGRLTESGMAPVIAAMLVEYEPASWHGVGLALGGQLWRMPHREIVYRMTNPAGWWTTAGWLPGPARGWFAEFLLRVEYRLPRRS
jgi:hypothetical protein